MHSGSLQSGHPHTVSFLSVLPTEFLDFSEQILHTLTGPAHCRLCSLLVFQNVETKLPRWQQTVEGYSVKASVQPTPEFKP
jgi:hypothetical protein